MKQEKIQLGLVYEKIILSPERCLYILSSVETGRYDKKKNKFICDTIDGEYYYLDGNNNYMCCTRSDINKIVMNLVDCKIQDQNDFFEQISIREELFFNNEHVIYIADIDEEIGDATFVKFDTDNVRKVLRAEELQKIDNKLDFDFSTDNDYQKEKNTSLVPVEQNDLLSLLELDLPDETKTKDYYELLKYKKKAEYKYHNCICLTAYIKSLLGELELPKGFRSPSIDIFKEGIRTGKIKEEDYLKYLDVTKNNIDLLGEYMNYIDNATLYGIDTDKIRQQKQEEYNFIFNELYNIKYADSIADKIKETVISQDEAIEGLISKANALALQDYRKKHNPNFKEKKTGILLTGSSGVGKTLLISTLGENLNRDLCIIDSPSLTMAGYKGVNIDECVQDCFEKLNYDKDRLEHAIIYFDEIDKKCLQNGGDISTFTQGVLNNLLKFLEGTTFKVVDNKRKTYDIKTDDMFIIAGGTFSFIYDTKQKNPMGFVEHQQEEEKLPTTEDFLETNAIPKEFLGRLCNIIHLKNLTKEDTKKILLESDVSPLISQKENFDLLGIKLNYTDEYLDAVSEKSVQSGLGARGLKGIVERSTAKAFYDVGTMYGEVEEVTLTEETIEDPAKYEVIKTKPAKTLVKKG